MKFENVTFSPIPTAADTRPESPVYLRLDAEELELLRAALAAEHANTVAHLGGMRYIGSSPAAMSLCRRRSEIEALLDRMSTTTSPFAVETRPSAQQQPRREAARTAATGWAA